jgi:hypothetical protein
MYFQDENGSPISIVGWEIRLTVKAKIDDPDSAAVISKIITVFSDPTAGIAEIELTPTDTNQAIGSYVYDVQCKTSAGEVYTILEGIITITKDVSITS